MTVIELVYDARPFLYQYAKTNDLVGDGTTVSVVLAPGLNADGVKEDGTNKLYNLAF